MRRLTEEERKAKHRAAAKAWAQANPERVKANKRRWAAENPDRVRAQARKATRKRLGHVDPTGETREGPCQNAGCGYIGPLHLDHDHETGAPRGWLCGPCNRALGLLQEETSRIVGLAQYLGGATTARTDFTS
jgi:hypothetical protein